jgi:general secretion pathway protein D
MRRTNPIGVVIDNMYWKKALEYILTSNGLQYKIYDRYYEITGGEEEGLTGVDKETQITPRSKEVRIEAIFFEADRKTLTQIGIDWTSLKQGKVKVDVTTTSNLADQAITGEYSSSTGIWDVTALMKAMESLSKGEVISKPQIKVISGRAGKVKVGKNFYLTTRDFAGNTTYREYEAGTILEVTPEVITISDTTFIHLKIKSERSQVIPDPTGVSKAITESLTEVLLLSGEQTVIAGLYSDEKTIARRGVPLLKDLPWWLLGIRYLFGYNSNEVVHKELVILLKAEIVPGIASRKINEYKQKKYFETLQKNIFK